MNKEKLIQFEHWVAEAYKQGKLRSPVHLSGGNEDQVIEIFKRIKPEDWVFSTYRSHYHALARGIPEEWLKQWILDNKSIHVMSKEYNFFTSAIVAGTVPIALGAAMGILRHGGNTHVWCFVGDMAAEGGTFHDAWKYAMHHHVPITFVIEDNGLSTDTPTQTVWGKRASDWQYIESSFPNEKDKIIYYRYVRKWPHYGTGVFVDFKEAGLKQDGTF